MKLGAITGPASMAVFVAGIALGQVAPKLLEFEIASIKPRVSGGSSSSMHEDSGGINATNVTMRQLILNAYEVQDFQLLGGPAWMNDDRWDVMAKAPVSMIPLYPNNTTDQQHRTIHDQTLERLRSLLADRFQLILRRETKEQPIYELVVSKSGPKIRPAKEPGGTSNVNANMTNGRATATYSAVTIEIFAKNLASRTGRMVVDKTGLSGKYDFKLEWTDDAGQPGVNLSDSAGPTLFTAIQEQLGLRLESQKGHADALIVERVEKASEN